MAATYTRSRGVSVPDGAFRPMSPWAYFGWGVVFHIPFIGWIIALIIAFTHENINRRNYARAFFVWLLVLFIFWLIVSITDWDLSWLSWIFF